MEDTMIERLQRLLDSEMLSYSGFADLIGVQRSSVSHIMSGRNKPSFDFLQKTLRALPHLNADWLILGEGEMLDSGLSAGELSTGADTDRSEGSVGSETPPGRSDNSGTDVPGMPGTGRSPRAVNQVGNTEKTGDRSDAGSITDTGESRTQRLDPLAFAGDEKRDLKGSGSRRIARVILLYNDNSFVSYEPEG